MNRRLAFLFLAAAALMGSACGDNPASSSGAVVVRGTVLGGTAGTVTAQSENGVAAAAQGRITVTVAEAPSITVTVSGNGTFVLEGLPLGSFTLVFVQDGVTIGTVTVTGVREGSEVKIVVQVEGTTIVVIELKVDDADTDRASANCIINGGRAGESIELEGHVSSGSVASFRLQVNGNRASRLVDVVTAGPSSYRCVGQAARDACPPATLAGSQVHVRGTLTACSTSEATVNASEVKVQK
jgi:hypothetical protein